MFTCVKKFYYRGLREYRFLSDISRGGMSRVYRVSSKLTGEILAVKILFPAYAARRNHVEKIFQEKQVEGDIAISLSHPNIIRTYSSGRFKDRYYFAMEYIKGPNIRQAIYKQPFLLKNRKSEIILQIAEGLNHLHSKGIIHRDICSKNVLLSPDGGAKIIDFGLSVLKRGNYRAEGERSGTPSYMAPEQIRGEEFDERTDIYSLGVTMYEILAERTPFAGSDNYSKMQNHLNHVPALLSRHVPGISKELAMIAGKAMEKNPDDRYPSAYSLILDLKDAVK